MARTQAGALLTERHRQIQLGIRQRLLREFLTISRVWNLADPGSFDRLVEIAIPLVQARHGASAGQAAQYFEQFRQVENVGGTAAAVVAPPVDRDQVAAGLYATGQAQARRSLSAGQAAEMARNNALVALQGSVTRLALDGGRNTLLGSALEDTRAVSWMRVTGPNPCAFCAMLASRGPAYTSRESAVGVTGRGGRPRGNRAIGESYHDNCTCSIEPYYEGSSMPDSSRRWRELWNQAQREASDAGELDRGTSNDALNAFRRLIGDTLTPAA